MSGDRCTGACCRSFVLAGIGRTVEEIDLFMRTRALDGAYIADMLIPLHAIEAGALLPNGALATETPPGGGWVFTCRHFDVEANNCTAYETRPGMCRNYPYGQPCEHADRCTWDRGRAGLHPPAKVSYREFLRDATSIARRTHLVVLDTSGKPQPRRVTR